MKRESFLFLNGSIFNKDIKLTESNIFIRGAVDNVNNMFKLCLYGNTFPSTIENEINSLLASYSLQTGAILEDLYFCISEVSTHNIH